MTEPNHMIIYDSEFDKKSGTGIYGPNYTNIIKTQKILIEEASRQKKMQLLCLMILLKIT